MKTDEANKKKLYVHNSILLRWPSIPNLTYRVNVISIQIKSYIVDTDKLILKII